MKTYIQEYGTSIYREAATPAKKNLLVVYPTSRKLDKGRSDTFHSISAKLLFVATRARIDILLVVIFLCSRVFTSKISRLLDYLKGTIDLEYVIAAEYLTRMQSWVDASYAVRPDIKVTPGEYCPLGLVVCSLNFQNKS
jgi:hypothetical protein